jgi:glyoxylase-like metal-dependent hydrolase (beta-lactamase superfamily II)
MMPSAKSGEERQPMRRNLRYLLGILLATVLQTSNVPPTAPVSAQQMGPVPQPFVELYQLAPDTYAWHWRGYTTFFVVTDAGVIAADPSALSDPRGADLFKAAIASVTDQPVRYLIMSHGNADHAAGSDVFADTAQLIGTELAAQKLRAMNSPRHLVPTIIVNDYMRLELGGKVLDLYWAGPISGGDHLFVHYPAGRVLFAVDWAEPGRLPFRTMNGTSSIEALVTALEWIETGFDYDVLIPGHRRPAPRSGAREVREYLMDLTAAIRTAQGQGHEDNSEEMVASVRAALAPRYGSWDNFNNQLHENIEGVIRIWSGM